MGNKFKNKIFIDTLFIVILGLIGVFLFFPVNLGGVHTCLFHRIFFQGANSNMDIANFSSTPAMADHSHLVRKYLVPFGFIWWFSLALVGWGILRYRNRRKTIDSKNKPNIKIKQ